MDIQALFAENARVSLGEGAALSLQKSNLLIPQIGVKKRGLPLETVTNSSLQPTCENLLKVPEQRERGESL